MELFFNRWRTRIFGDPNKKNAVLEVLHNGPFRSMWFGQVASQLAANALIFVLAIRIYRLTGSSTAVSGLFLTFGIPALLIGMAAGAVVDHFDKRSVLLFCDLARAAGAVVFLLLPGNLPAIYILALLYSIIAQFYTPALGSSIPRLVPASSIVTANSIFSFTFYSSLAVGSIFAGPLLKLFGPYGVFLFIAGLFLFAVLLESKIPKEKIEKKVTLKEITALLSILRRVARSVRDGIAYVTARPVLLDALLLLTGTQIILGLMAALGPAFADRVLEIDVHDASVFIVGPVVAGIVIGALWVGNVGFRLGTKRLTQYGVLGAGIALAMVALVVRLKRVAGINWLVNDATVLPISLAIFFLLGIANSMLDVPANSILQENTEGEMRGRVYGILTAAVGGLGMLPIVLSGILADVIGVGRVIFLLGVLVFAYGVYRIKFARRL